MKTQLSQSEFNQVEKELKKTSLSEKIREMILRDLAKRIPPESIQDRLGF